ncbi:hypothetical protein, partial [Streptomyces pilosus]
GIALISHRAFLAATVDRRWELVLARIGAAELNLRGRTAAMELSLRGLVGTARLACAHPIAAGALAAAVSIYAYRNRTRLTPTRTPLARVGTEAGKVLSRPFIRHEEHQRSWKDADAATPGMTCCPTSPACSPGHRSR